MPNAVRIIRIPGTPTVPLRKLKTFGIHDLFGRANNPASLGTSDDNKTWLAWRGVWGILDGAAYVSDLSANGQKIAVAQSYASDGRIEAQFSAIDAAGDGSAGIILRGQDINNHLIANNAGGGKLRLWKRVNGAAVAIADGPAAVGIIGSGDVLSVEMNGPSIRVYKNGGLAIDVANAPEFAAATLHGPALNAAGTRVTRFDFTAAV
uniref:hypothetical protein n=1 Tax=Microbacterium proteolyticum TaxID=1572644 RepID=UPI002415F85C|nr:hypothetical protein [Microbacterium proteolyticum]